MKHVPPSVSAALKRRGRDDILQQEGEYQQYKSQIDQIIHGDDALQSDSEDYENDIEPSSTPEEAKANKVIEGYGEKYADNNKETKESKTQRWNEIFNKMGLDDDDLIDMIYDYVENDFYDELAEELGYEDVQELTNEDIINAIDDEDIVEIIDNAGYLDEYEKATSDDAEDEEDDYDVEEEKDEQQYKVGTKFSAKNPFIKKEDQTYEITNIGKDYVEIAGPGGFSQRLSKEKFQKIIDAIKGK